MKKGNEMVKESKTGRAGSIDERRKSAWNKPALTRIAAGEAEVFTRASNDGPFSSS